MNNRRSGEARIAALLCLALVAGCVDQKPRKSRSTKSNSTPCPASAAPDESPNSSAADLQAAAQLAEQNDESLGLSGERMCRR
jgi:hypothetical protein